MLVGVASEIGVMHRADGCTRKLEDYRASGVQAVDRTGGGYNGQAEVTGGRLGVSGRGDGDEATQRGEH